MNIRLYDGQITDMSCLCLIYHYVIIWQCRVVCVTKIIWFQPVFLLQLLHECTFKQPRAYLMFHSGMTAASIAKAKKKKKRTIKNYIICFYNARYLHSLYVTPNLRNHIIVYSSRLWLLSTYDIAHGYTCFETEHGPRENKFRTNRPFPLLGDGGRGNNQET